MRDACDEDFGRVRSARLLLIITGTLAYSLGAGWSVVDGLIRRRRDAHHMGFITARAEVEKAKAAGDMTAADDAGAESAT